MSCLDEVLYSASPRVIGSRVWSTEDIWRVHLHRFHLSCQTETSKGEAGRRILIPGLASRVHGLRELDQLPLRRHMSWRLL
ncbi:hypothetical protein BKA56DRAFT_111390 [Ilyonectria sp. MPI-CAGE-AT-0026]|nr:hypothetical protein BKA56DRAFT_111390 [Ilyonectria sp. MPI-CAGE-AT-0026]